MTACLYLFFLFTDRLRSKSHKDVTLLRPCSLAACPSLILSTLILPRGDIAQDNKHTMWPGRAAAERRAERERQCGAGAATGDPVLVTADWGAAAEFVIGVLVCQCWC